MQKLFNVKRGTKIFGIILISVFVLLSCGVDVPKKVVNKFLHNFKNKNFTESYEYLNTSEETTIFKNHIETILDSKNFKDEFKSLNQLMIDKIFDFDYEIINETKENDVMKFQIKLNYYNLPEAYESALHEFLERSLDFDNVNNLYKVEYISELLISHIKKLHKEEKIVNIKVVKDKDWKIVFTKELSEILTGNSIKLLDILKSNIFFN